MEPDIIVFNFEIFESSCFGFHSSMAVGVAFLEGGCGREIGRMVGGSVGGKV